MLTTQDKGMTALKEQCKGTNEEIKEMKSTFRQEMSELRESISSLMTVVGASLASNKYNVPSQIQTGTPPGLVSPLDGYKADPFTGMSIQQRAKEIREAEAAAARQNIGKANAIDENTQLNNVVNNYCGKATAPVGGHPQE